MMLTPIESIDECIGGKYVRFGKPKHKCSEYSTAPMYRARPYIIFCTSVSLPRYKVNAESIPSDELTILQRDAPVDQWDGNDRIHRYR